MLFTKMNIIIDEINNDVAEREELTELIAICLIAGKNLFILGDTGQAKSYAINEFRKRIVGAKQFERLMSKQTDEEQIFGRLDLSSLIPGSVPKDELMKEEAYVSKMEEVKSAYEKYKANSNQESLYSIGDKCTQLSHLQRVIGCLRDGNPKMITMGKIPDSHIVFLDEIFKSNDGILNSLLTALNEKVYTNEGETVNIPVISFFSASNEIPNFNDSTQAILKPLYDRFELKVLTQYVQEKDNRLKILKQKQSNMGNTNKTYISLSDLYDMQKEAEKIVVPDSINELMDEILCMLRRGGIHVSDRKFFGFTPIVRAKAYLNGNKEVMPKDLMVLKNYFWNKPEEITLVEKILTEVCENPIGTEIAKLIDMANESRCKMEETVAEIKAENSENPNLAKPYSVFTNEVVRIYKELMLLKTDDISSVDNEAIINAEKELNDMLEGTKPTQSYVVIPLAQRVATEF